MNSIPRYVIAGMENVGRHRPIPSRMEKCLSTPQANGCPHRLCCMYLTIGAGHARATRGAYAKRPEEISRAFSLSGGERLVGAELEVQLCARHEEVVVVAADGG
ncbi:hypothetical protein, partial [Microvirga zambiensis]|uniref:hypothetical protein n=1 Tax=Microvirga zambiensis TaxID=1402137 RepID=UPI001AEF7947